jgi:glucosamine--fructose-6-phosphate aminotransferase (isomerizing)
MEPIPSQVMVRQVESLGADLRALVPEVARRLPEALAGLPGHPIREVLLVGSGDSHHASVAAVLAFESLARVRATAVTSLGFAAYAEFDPGHTLVVGISASGNTPIVVRCLQRAAGAGARTLAVTGDGGSALSAAADATLVVAPRHREPSPGIRTYQASLLGLLMLAVHLGPSAERQEHHRELAYLGDLIEETVTLGRDVCRRLARRCAGSPVMMLLGSGPSLGTAMYAAAKMVEGAGLLAVGQDLEEWCHVERFAFPLDMPLVVIGPPGRARAHALAVAGRAYALGRQVAVVAHAGDGELAGHADEVLAVPGPVREEFSPLVYHVFAGMLAAATADRLARMPFRRDIGGPHAPSARR